MTIKSVKILMFDVLCASFMVKFIKIENCGRTLNFFIVHSLQICLLISENYGALLTLRLPHLFSYCLMPIFVGGIITLDDLDSYEPYDKVPQSVHLSNGNYTVYGPPPPSGAVVVQYVLNMMDGKSLYIL